MLNSAPTNIRAIPTPRGKQNRQAIAIVAVVVCGAVGVACWIFSKPQTPPTPQTALPPGCENPVNRPICDQIAALAIAYDQALARFDMGQNPNPQEMGTIQKAVINEAFRSRNALEEQMRTPGHPCNLHPTRHRLSCARGAIATNVLKEVALAEEGHPFAIARLNEDGTIVALDKEGNPVPGRRFVLVQVDEEGNTIADPTAIASLRSASPNEIAALGMMRGTAISIAATDIPLSEYDLAENVAKAQVAWEQLHDATQVVAAQVAQPLDTSATVERSQTYWKRELEGTTQQGEVSP